MGNCLEVHKMNFFRLVVNIRETAYFWRGTGYIDGHTFAHACDKLSAALPAIAREIEGSVGMVKFVSTVITAVPKGSDEYQAAFDTVDFYENGKRPLLKWFRCEKVTDAQGNEVLLG